MDLENGCDASHDCFFCLAAEKVVLTWKLEEYDRSRSTPKVAIVAAYRHGRGYRRVCHFLRWSRATSYYSSVADAERGTGFRCAQRVGRGQPASISDR